MLGKASLLASFIKSPRCTLTNWCEQRVVTKRVQRLIIVVTFHLEAGVIISVLGLDEVCDLFEGAKL